MDYNKIYFAKEIICENCGVTFTAKGERKLCSLRCVRKYAANQHKVSIQDDVGNIFGSLTDAAKFHGVTVEAIRYRIRVFGKECVQILGVGIESSCCDSDYSEYRNMKKGRVAATNEPSQWNELTTGYAIKPKTRF